MYEDLAPADTGAHLSYSKFSGLLYLNIREGKYSSFILWEPFCSHSTSLTVGLCKYGHTNLFKTKRKVVIKGMDRAMTGTSFSQRNNPIRWSSYNVKHQTTPFIQSPVIKMKSNSVSSFPQSTC